MGRPVFYPELGKFFRALRTSRKWGLRQAAQKAGHKGLAVLTKSTLHSLEAGKTKNVDPDILRSLAALYDQPYEDLVARFVAVRYQIGSARDLIRHSGTGQTGSHLVKGESNVPAETRLRELRDRAEKAEEERDTYKLIVETAGELASKLATTLRPKGVGRARRQAARGGHH